MGSVIKKIIYIFLAAFLIVYLLMYLVLPALINSQSAYLANLISDKTGAKTEFKGFKFKSDPFLNYSLVADKLNIKTETYILDISKFKGNFFAFKPDKTNIDIDSVYFKHLKSTKTHKKPDFNLSKISKITLNKGIFEFSKGKLNISNLNYQNNVAKADMEFYLYPFTTPVKTLNSAQIRIEKNKIASENLSLYFNNSKINISGTLYDSKTGSDFKIISENFPSNIAVESFLYFKKYIQNKKYFIENFKDFNGNISLNLAFKNKSIFGSAILSDARAKSIPLNAPIVFNKIVFNFTGDTVYAKDKGKIADENAVFEFFLTGLESSKPEIFGSVSANVTNHFAKKYLKDAYIKNSVSLVVSYLIKNGISDIVYEANFPQGSDISFKNANLGLDEFNRNLSVTTRKEKDEISILNYAYSYKSSRNIPLVFGNGEFKKKNDHYYLNKISAKTQNKAPVSLLGFLDKRLNGGTFNGNLLYDFENEKLTGALELNDTYFKDFYIKSSAVFADNNLLTLLAMGEYRGEDFNANVEVVKKSGNSVLIKKLDLYLKKFVHTKSRKTVKAKKSAQKLEDEVFIWDIDNFILRLDEFVQNNITIKNILIKGKVHKNILDFVLLPADFAGGTLSAYGTYNDDKDSSSVKFFARNIDSNTAAYQLFNLKDEFSGKANGLLDVKFSNFFSKYKGYCAFSIKEGAIKDIGSFEFIIKRKNKKNPFKFSLSDIIKVDKKLDFSQTSNIKGHFDIDDDILSNIRIFASNKLFALYLKGEYNIDSSMLDAALYGAYDSRIEKLVSVFHIPLGWLRKFIFKTKENDKQDNNFKNLPDIKAASTKRFSATLKGSVNNLKNAVYTLNSYK